ncbi:hypothetical protein A2348_00780 [Candidatus Uhrbacteria bacterium RIFOXYB12_FULL_58_10]|uniref:Uncharacterized protein n=1 Tax=Candidatus Uhrbacteria bacterium RIFOXYB2_FULL_57_15 TaxID=1802422 RepID=A0A1F7W4X6_9BACT|nr:MAG: hypothetical protein A2348_00780 [Candidatus Uhrbacteria bacterium RIFOXYB12_FULL_58_10]OGL97809.1 MAG: hypothetical protein A2304_03785 [Candidatus Uhrbacteria bacterium RIFOXYB2_FULL_57_15]OGL99918.1 MAG: hypothetical protein A2501_04830 [Candidatus Uhrbacteria bacterium RIFOXYC12_FULL_57_11]
MGLLEKLTQKGNELTNEQKVAFVLLVFLGLGGLVMGYFSFGANIRRPFDIQIAERASEEPYLTLTQKEEKEKEDQKTRDTDSDGLSDYDELYVFRTSPYITDTDSDGIDDKTEVYAGQNPSCPEGKTCGTASGDASGASTAASDLVGSLSDSPFARDLSQYDFQSEEDIQAFVKSITVDEIRKALATAGVPQDQLDAIADDQLQTLFEQTLSTASESGELDALVGAMQAQAGASGSDGEIQQ